MQCVRAGAAATLVTMIAAAACNRAAPEATPREPSMEASDNAASSSAAVPAAASAASSSATMVANPAHQCILPLASVAPAVPPKAATCPPDPLAGNPPKLPLAEVRFEGAPNSTVRVEIATPPDWTERGLMFRTKMDEDAGMFFDLQENKDHEFWMHNTCIPLDLLYIERDGTLVGVVESAPTLNDEPRGVGCFSSYVLEVNAGWVRRHGVRPGQKLVLPTMLSHG